MHKTSVALGKFEPLDASPDGMLAYMQAITGPSKNRDDPNWPIQSFDHCDWAEAFIKIVKDNNVTIDEEYMRVWFANALMRGYDQGQLHLHHQLPWFVKKWLRWERHFSEWRFQMTYRLRRIKRSLFSERSHGM